MIKVGFDISQVAHKGGVPNYTKNLAEQLYKLKDLDMIFFYSSLRKSYTGNLPKTKVFPIPPTLLELLFNRIRILPIETFIGKIDIFHSSDWIQPPTRAKKVTTYHDVVPLKYPQWSNPKVVAVHKKRLALVEKEVDKVIAVSKSTKNDLLELSNISEGKIQIIYEAAGEQFKPQSPNRVEEFRRKFNLPDKFVLAIGGVGSRRNSDRIKKASEKYNLVTTGQDISWLSDEELPLLYSAAEVLFYPSLYEGFGLPILEAMACGVPVITSNVSSMPEVGGEAAIYVNPENQNDLNDKLEEVMANESLRNKMVKLGLMQAKKFSWEKTAQQTAALYREILK